MERIGRFLFAIIQLAQIGQGSEMGETEFSCAFGERSHIDAAVVSALLADIGSVIALGVLGRR